MEERVSYLEGAYEHVATKADIADLRGELKADIADLRGELKADIADLRGELKTDIINLQRWLLGTVLGGVAATGTIVAIVIKLMGG
jgi:hypothetical protein